MKRFFCLLVLIAALTLSCFFFTSCQGTQTECDHSLGEWIISVEPTCEAEGEETRSCSLCSYSESRKVQKKEHSYVSSIVDPACENEGYTEHACSCGYSYRDSITDALGHDMGDWTLVTEPTCASEGTETRSCSRCSHSESREIEKKDHSYVSNTVEPDCENEGYTEHVCHCGDSYRDSITDALGHDLSDWTLVTAPTCDTEGEQMRICSRCSHTKSEKIDKKGHSYVSNTVEPDCENEGYTEHVCHCGDSYRDDITDALGHSYSWTEIFAGSCVEVGKESGVCSRCGDAQTRETGFRDHTPIADKGYAADCEKEGLTDGSHCSVCSKILSKQSVIEPLGHNYSDGKCTRCGKIAANVYVDGLKKNDLPAKGNYVVFAKDGDNYVVWDYKAWQPMSNSESVYIYFFSVNKLYASVSDMKANASKISAGDVVGVISYYAGYGRGAAIYTVSSSYSESAIKIANGKYAYLKPFTAGGKKIVTVDQFGARADGSSCDADAIIAACGFSGADTIVFEGKAYRQTKGITLSGIKNKTINGNGAYIYNEYTSLSWTDLALSGCSDLTVINLGLHCTETDGRGVLYQNNDHVQLHIKNCTNILLDGVTIYTPNNTSNDRHVTSVWIHTGNNGITIQNSTIKNLSGSSVGGGIWVSGSNNVNILNNYIEKSSHDEILAFFMVSCNGALVEGNYIYTHDEPAGDASAHAVSFGVWGDPTSCIISNVTFRNNVLDVVSSKDAIMFENIDNVHVYDNDITLRQNSPSEPIQNAVFRVPEPNKATQKNSSIYNNTIKVYSSKYIPLFESCSNIKTSNNSYSHIKT